MKRSVFLRRAAAKRIPMYVLSELAGIPHGTLRSNAGLVDGRPQSLMCEEKARDLAVVLNVPMEELFVELTLM